MTPVHQRLPLDLVVDGETIAPAFAVLWCVDGSRKRVTGSIVISGSDVASGAAFDLHHGWQTRYSTDPPIVRYRLTRTALRYARSMMRPRRRLPTLEGA